MNVTPSLRLTPSNSPFLKTSPRRSPTRSSRSEETGLKLRKVIGTTTATANGFDCLPSSKQFAYTAGAAAVVCTVEQDLTVTQRFFRARPHAPGTSKDVSWPIPQTSDFRSKAIGNLREQGLSGSPLAASTRDWPDSPVGKSTTVKDRVKAATSVALSPNGKWIAIGETGYKPRILIFSNRGDSSEVPVTALSEHAFGVHALAFSPDSRYLASLGTVNDGFLFVWAIDDRTGAAALHSSNKCTSTINAMAWLGRGILTVGLRYVKLWKLDNDAALGARGAETSSGVLTPKQKPSDFAKSVLSPRSKVLSGKNSLLGDLIDANFVAAVSLETGKAVLCAESGEICLLDDSENTQALTHLGTVRFRITAAMIDESRVLHVAGAIGQSKRFTPADLQKQKPATSKRDRRSTLAQFRSLSSYDAITVTAMAKISDVVVELDSKRGITLTKAGDSASKDADVASLQLAAHSEAVLGVSRLSLKKLPDAAFLTYAGNGGVHIWNSTGAAVTGLQVPVESSLEMYDLTNELKAVAHIEEASLLVAGDRYGSLAILDIATSAVILHERAHSAEIVDLICFERMGVTLIATASRDRMVQSFAWCDSQLDLLQTMDEHVAGVTALASASDGQYLLSCSADRTIVVREAFLRNEDDPRSIIFVMMRTITLKSSPLSMCLGADQDELLVSAADRSVYKYSIKSGQSGFGFKCSDSEGGEAAALSKILYAHSLNGSPAIIGVSSGDKSIRLYSDFGSLIARDWGHTEGITDAALLESSDWDGRLPRTQLITVALDSTIFMWDTNAATPKELISEADEGLEGGAGSRLTPLAPPLRKVLSYSELSRFKREKSMDGEEVVSPQAIVTPTQPPSPRRLKKKTSRTSIMSPPRLEPTFRPSFAQSRRDSARKRSPSPPSPKEPKREVTRKPSLGMSLRSKSTENVLSSFAPPANPGFGSVASSTESVCRNLRAYRKKLANFPGDAVPPQLLRDLGAELKLTARALEERSRDSHTNGATMLKSLDRESDIRVDVLDKRIEERADSGLRRSNGHSPSQESIVESPRDIDAVAGALGRVALE